MIKVLMLIPDNPFDSTNGAARSVRTICEMLAGEPDFNVKAMATGSHALDPSGYSVLFTYGQSPVDRMRRDAARRAGCKVVFALRNSNYMEPGLLEPMDGILTPSQWLTDQYRKIGIESTPLPLPMNLEDVVSLEHYPVYITMVNLAVHKGRMLMVTLLNEVYRRRPDIPFLIVRSNAPAMPVPPNAIYLANQPFPRDIFAQTKILLVPSVFEEPGGRVAVEALLNGVPPIVSDRGALPEVVNGAGFVVHIPKEITIETDKPVPVEAVESWIDAIVRLWDGPDFYADASAEAKDAAVMYGPSVLAPMYAEYFRSIVTSAPPSESKESQ